MDKQLKEYEWTIEDVIRMAVKVTKRMRKHGVQLHWTVTSEPCEPDIVTLDPPKRKGKRK